jgi:alpha-mannosidase
MNFDAWDIDIYYQEKMSEVAQLIEAVVEEAGPLRGALRLRWHFYDSVITQRLTLYRYSPRIDFRTEVDWQEQQVLLKVAFPVEVRSTRATYDIQFGQIERPTHWNTSWDYARFEKVAHKWVDLSEGNYGVALLNDCKYGHDVKDNVMRLTLIKSSIRPDARADKGRHIFTYSLLPHAGDWRQGGVIAEGYALNNPALAAIQPSPLSTPLPRAGEGGRGMKVVLSPRYAFAEVDADHVIVETVKKAESVASDDAWIVRVYETQQSRNPAVHLDFGQPICHAVECNLVEEGEGAVAYQGRRLTFAIAPYEIKTFKLWF